MRFQKLSNTLPIALMCARAVAAFDNTRFDNLAVYWGQNSYGAGHSNDPANFQKRLSFYCGDDSTIDVFPVAFLHVFFGQGGLPSINLANTCNTSDNATFPGTQLPDCSSLAADVKQCQAKGKLVTLSLGGATGAVGFTSDSQAQTFADTVWNLFLGGSSSTRPFGDAVLDGVDLDIESGNSNSYAAFITRLRTLSRNANRRLYVSAAPQCPFPDAALGTVLNAVEFDAVYVQFYNNFCGLNHFDEAQNWNFGTWDIWARTTSPNKNIKVYVGAPASSTAAGQGYVDAATLSRIATTMRKNFPSFGGVMLWDASQAYANNRFDRTIKNALVAAGGTGFTFPACTAPAFVPGTNYVGGSTVSYNGYIWQAKFFASSAPNNNPNGEWSAISACSSSGIPPPTTTEPTTTEPVTTGPTPEPTTSQPTPIETSTTTSCSCTTVTFTSDPSGPTSPTPGGNCDGVAAWTSTRAYTAGQKAVFGGHLWTANWWTQATPPNSNAGDWTDNGPCTTANSRVSASFIATATPEPNRA